MSATWSRSSSCIRVLARAPRRQLIQQKPRQLRYSTSQSTAQAQQTSGSSSALVGGITGGLVTFAGGYAWYYFSGAKTALDGAHATKEYFDSAKKKIASAAPDVENPNEVLKWLRTQATAYAAFIPGGSAFVKSAFDDIDSVRGKHGKEVDTIVKDAYNELKEITDKKGFSVETAWEGWGVLQRQLEKIGELAEDSASQILDNHPEMKKKLGKNLGQIKQMGERLGPEAKKQVEDLWTEIGDIIKKSGMNIEAATTKLENLLKEKVEKLQKLGADAWKKELKAAQPLLDKNPEIKKLIEENTDQLKQGNAQELFLKVKDAVNSGDTSNLKDFVNKAAEKASKSNFGSGVDQYLKMVPGGGQIIPKLKELKEITKEHGEEAETLIENTLKEIGQVLDKRMKEGQELAKKAKKSK
ncbi:hypothetical protein H072_521 [Dactylellina haptotyla CBS 200.50]|uniref:Uncharacterized protein n=1 Tax=Dactylellina haptotyla (strain CBS 200.50) TaxID=1284197 RepID=S8ARL4_DACHA|nr:hypothetical protein H072_521 [Dactylellina haptotyla CBS 200.50]